MHLHRRQFLAIASSAVVLTQSLPGCALLNRDSEFELAVADLEKQLAAAADGQAEEEVFIAASGAIAQQARTLLSNHERFLRDLDRNLRDRSVSEAALLEQVRAYDASYREGVAELLSLQKILHDRLTDDEWASVAQALNGTARELKARSLGAV